MLSALTVVALTLPICPSSLAQCTEDGSCSSPDQVVQLVGAGGSFQFTSDLLVNSSVFGGGPDTVDWHAIEAVEPGDSVQVDVSFDDSVGNLGLRLRNGCGASLGVSDTNNDFESVSWTNTTGSTVDVAIELFVPEVITGTTCLDYTVDVFWADSCILAPDPIEPNDSCASAAPVGAGSYPGLSVEGLSDDWFSLEVPALATGHVVSTWQGGEIDLELYTNCQQEPLVQSVPINGSAQVTFENTALSMQTIFVQARTIGLGCSSYELTISIENGQPGQPYCSPDPNTTGTPAALSSFGSSSLSVDNLTFFAAPLVPEQVGIFFSGAALGQIPFFGRTLCVAPPLIRSPVLPTGATGVLVWTYDNHEPMATPGTTRYFQAFYRDPTDPVGLNLTNAYRVTFTQ